jgi:CheY-like chemotaxis protein
MSKIMLVEDDNNLREIYEARLLAEGYEIVSAHDGEEALAMAVKEKPDLIISDVMMPKISGFDMLDILRSTPETKNTKVVMMTALSQAEDRERAEKLGADKYLVKSQVTLEDVAKVAREMLEGEAPAKPTAPAPTDAMTASAPAPTPPVIEPTAPPAPEPVVTDPVEPTVPAAAPAEPQATPPAPDPATTDASTTSTTTASEPVIDPALSQTTASEEAEIDKQIDEFVAKTYGEEPQPEAPAATEPETKPAEASDSELDGGDDTPLTAAPASQASVKQIEVAEAPEEEPASQATPSSTPSVISEAPTPEEEKPSVEAAEPRAPITSVGTNNGAVNGKKVIQPINDPTKPTDMNALLEKEQEKEAMAAAMQPVETPPAGQLINAPQNETSEEEAAPPAHPSTTVGPDPNSIAL